MIKKPRHGTSHANQNPGLAGPLPVGEVAGSAGVTEQRMLYGIAKGMLPAARYRFEIPPDLPRIRTPLIGRDDEMSALEHLLPRDDVPLVTLIGPGGVGKTRLAVDVTDRIRDAFQGQVWSIALASLADPAAMSSTIARKLGIQDFSEPLVLHRLVGFIRDRRALLILDNFERLTAAAGVLAVLLSTCPNLTILVTSRVPLHLSEEQRFQVTPLPVRGDAAGGGKDGHGASLAAQLFAQRARMVRADFALTEENSALVEAICQRIDGLPLAIELAAARCSTLTLTAIRDRLDASLTLLTHGAHDRPERLWSLRNAIAWSHDLLRADEQRLLRWLSVFSGGWTLEAAAAVLGDTSPTANATLDSLTALVESSLVNPSAGTGNSARFTMLETIREYGLAQLEEHGELETVRAAHAAHYVAFGEGNLPNRVAPDERFDNRLRRVEVEWPNLRAALAHLAKSGDALGLLRLAGALGQFWHFQNRFRDGRAWLERSLADVPQVAPLELVARAKSSLAMLLWSQGENEHAMALARDYRQLAERIGDRYRLAGSFMVYGLCAAALERWQEAFPAIERACAMWVDLGARAEESSAHVAMSTIAMGMGDTELALAEARRATDIAEALGHTTNQARAQVSLARLARLGGDTGQATISYRKALVLWNSIDTHWWKVDPLIGLAEIAADRAHAIEAAKLLGAADALIAEEEVSGTSYAFPFTKAAYGRIETISCGILGPEQFEAARRDGRILAFDDVLRIVDTIAPLATSTAHESRLAHASKLSARELDILQLAARGLTDEEIAGNLFLSRRTVSNHVSHILAKLDVTTRGKAVAKAGMMGILPPLHSDR